MIGKKNVLSFLFGLSILFVVSCKTDTETSTTASISGITCSSATFSGTPVLNTAFSGTATVPYSGGNSLSYTAGEAIASTGVTGLTATLQAGTLSEGSGSFTYTITGTPTSSGTASFEISFGEQSCTLNLPVASAAASVSALTCSSAIFSTTTAISGSSYTGTATVPYTGGNSVAYAAGDAIASTGVTGLTATLQAGMLSSSGNLVYTIAGTPASSGTASFAIAFGGQSCSLSLSVGAGTTSSCDSESGVAKIVCLAEAFKATLSSSQISTLQLDYTFTNAKKWSNLPAGMSARNGIKLGSLSSTQLAVAKALIKEMTGTVANEGYDEVQQVWLADDYLYANGGGSDYGSGNYYIAFLGTPSMTGTFEILETGHHKTVANTYVNGVLVGATPHFEAVEPISWTSSGTTYAPISQERDTFVSFLNSLSSTQLSSAKSSSTFSDLVLVPGKEWQFPSTRSGMQCSGLSSSQKSALLEVIKTYTNDIDETDAAAFLTLYTNELDDTYVLYSGTTAMTTKFDYFRIDGPHVWIEFVVAGGVIFQNQTHIHSIWRDRSTDYAGTKN
ncbi:DUF3500 domain-containing protein [Xanthocytophaga agilis]|uniref:DUF3500 domain-containing protein n=1 Tax=Xanthocytophaga agilis TaxID=3048010 RepID=A0AAE3R3R3_9BACT|nr:DUF3500 domain-containing protein [Xanthocytophaga agilis]MDJ1500122.1 DUF3500 domain-containing protein [Xanthocytophaga agilis]